MKRAFENTVVIFYPHVRSDPNASTYSHYCKLALLKFKPWANQFGLQPFNGINRPTDEEYISEWNSYLKECDEKGLWVPDALQRDIDNYILNQNNIPSQNVTSVFAIDNVDNEDPFAHEDIDDADFLEINNDLPVFRNDFEDDSNEVNLHIYTTCIRKRSISSLTSSQCSSKLSCTI